MDGNIYSMSIQSREPEHVALQLDNKQSARHQWTVISRHPGALSAPDQVIEYIKAIAKAFSFGIYSRTKGGGGDVEEGDQGTILINLSLRVKMRENTIKNVFYETILHGASIWPLPHQSTEEIFFSPIGFVNGITYRLKQGLWTSKSGTCYIMPEKVRDIQKNDLWWGWQKHIIEDMKKGDYDGRCVNMIIDPPGS